MTLIEEIFDLMSLDFNEDEENSKHLVSCYNKCSSEEKIKVNLCFIHLCGKSLKDLIKEMDNL